MWADGFSPRQIWRACPCTERTTLSTHVYYTSIRTSVPCFLPNANKVNEILRDQAERAQMGLKLDHVPEGVLLDRFASLGLSVIIPGVLGNLNIPSIGLHHVYPLLLTRFIFTISPKKKYIYIFLNPFSGAVRLFYFSLSLRVFALAAQLPIVPLRPMKYSPSVTLPHLWCIPIAANPKYARIVGLKQDWIPFLFCHLKWHFFFFFTGWELLVEREREREI